jgi:hypothetical protein
LSRTYIPKKLRRLVEERAEFRCEYCLLPTVASYLPHEVDHVIPEQHGGATTADNLALACPRCNNHKGTNLGSFDPQTGQFSFLFNPRTQKWDAHFVTEEDRIVGLSPEGRTTVWLLRLNQEARILERLKLRLAPPGNP